MTILTRLIAGALALALLVAPAYPVPQGTPAPSFPTGPWTTYTPSMNAASGTITTRGASASRYLLVGKTLYLSLSETITTNGSAAGSVNISLPPGLALASEARLRGWEANGNKGLLYAAGAGQGFFSVYSENPVGYPGADGVRFDLSTVVEVQ